MKYLMVAIALLLTTPAWGIHGHHHHHSGLHRHTTHSFHSSRHSFGHHNSAHYGASGLVTVPTAAGISITVASNLASKFQGFINDLHSEGYNPHHLGCYASGGHVTHSNHYHGGACDFDQSGRNKTASRMYHVSALAAKWGLRDGCTFHDCGHIDDGVNVGWHTGTTSHSTHHRHLKAYAKK